MSAPSARAAALSAGAGLALVVTAGVVWRWTYSDIDVEFPPLHATWDPRFGLLTLPAIAIGLTFWLGLPRLAERLPWRALLVTAFASTWLWTMALAMTEGKDGLSRGLERRPEYL